jgi:hypothetical protein
MHTDRVSRRVSSWHHPSVLEVEHLGSHLGVGVVVHDRQLVLSREYRRRQIADAHRSMRARGDRRPGGRAIQRVPEQREG